MKNNLQSLNLENLKNIVIGSTFFGGGGGGSREEGDALVELMKEEGGSGLGLALCVKVAELHGGFLQIESQPGEGTTVRAVF